jgi:putative ABC transport system permease protein
MSLALATLLYEWRRYMAAVVALAFSGLLVLAQVGMFVGIGKGFTAQIDRARADIMVLGPGAKALFGGPSGLPRRMIPLVYSHPEVTQVAPLDGSGGRFQNILSPRAAGQGRGPRQEAAARARAAAGGGGRKTEFVNVTVIDAIPGYVTVPTDYTQSMIEALRQPYAVAVDQTALASAWASRRATRRSITARPSRSPSSPPAIPTSSSPRWSCRATPCGCWARPTPASASAR